MIKISSQGLVYFTSSAKYNNTINTFCEGNQTTIAHTIMYSN